ncbi:MAG: 50S ribosomal protein L18e [Nanoarchaeota archaeon]|mgnify:CR=1 FL=1
MKKTGPTNPTLQRLIQELREASKKNKADIWKVIAKELEKPTRRRREVNILRINRHTKANETIVVPGKVLATGDMDHKVKVAAWQFSEAARSKVQAMSIPELIKENPKGKDVRIIG